MQNWQGDSTIEDTTIELAVPVNIKKQLVQLLNEYGIVCVKKEEGTSTTDIWLTTLA